MDLNFTFHGNTDYKNANIRYEYTPWEVQELDRCVEDPEYMIETYCKFMTDHGHINVTLRKYQRELIHLMGDEHWDEKEQLFIADNRKVLVMQSRQTGKTSTTVSYLAHYVISHRERNIVIGANNKDTAEEIMQKFLEVFQALPWFLKIGVKSLSKKSVTFDNGCSIKCVATTNSGGVGKTAHLLILDEFGVIPAATARSFWTAIKPTLSSSKVSQVIILSTPRSKSHIFYELYTGSIQGKNDFVTKTVYYWEAGGERATDEWKQQQIAEIGERAFAQEFDLRFDAGGGGRLVGAADMAFIDRIRTEFRSVPIYGVPNNISQKILWAPWFNPDELIEDDLTTRKFVLQIDTAGGYVVKINNNDDKDWNVINIYEVELLSPARIKRNRLGYKEVKMMDCIRFRQIGIYMDHEFNEEFSADAAKHIVFTVFKNGQGSWMGEIDNIRIMIEVNFNGVNWIRKFMKHDMFYPQLIVKTKHSQNAVRKDYGFKTVSGSRGKGYWCEAGARMIERRQIIVCQDTKLPQTSTVQQLGAFGKNARGQYCGEAMHDDIAVTVLFVSIIVEQEEFQLWIEDWFRMLGTYDIFSWEKKKKITEVAKLMDQYIEQTFDEEYSQQDIKTLYGNAVSGFGRITGNTSSGNGLPIYAQPGGGYGQGGYGQGGYQTSPYGNQNYGAYSRGTRYQNPFTSANPFGKNPLTGK